MNLPRTSTRPLAAPKRTSSGNHPAVREFRKKLESIGEGVGEKLAGLDADLEEYLKEVKSDPPPAHKGG